MIIKVMALLAAVAMLAGCSAEEAAYVRNVEPITIVVDETIISGNVSGNVTITIIFRGE